MLPGDDLAPGLGVDPGEGDQVTEFVDSAEVTSPEVSLVTKTPLRIRITFLSTQVSELGSDFVAHVPIRERDDEISTGPMVMA